MTGFTEIYYTSAVEELESNSNISLNDVILTVLVEFVIALLSSRESIMNLESY